jgi:3-phosphoshikimate 1-carboxyvinyltransferase
MMASIFPQPLNGKIEAISSKADAHRLILASFLSKNHTDIELIHPLGKDIKATINCIQALGCIVETKTNGITIHPCDRPNSEAVLDCKESGTTLRFLVPIVATLGGKYKFFGNGSLPNRPITELLEALCANGCKTNSNSLPFEISGELTAGRYVLPGNITSQYFSGLLFALPLLAGDSEIILSNPIESELYVDMTINTLKIFGINIAKTKSGYYILGKQEYKTPENIISAEGDWSNSAFWLAAGGLSKRGISCIGINEESSQPDKQIVRILKNINAKVENIDCGWFAQSKGETLRPFVVDAREAPDLIPICAVLMCFAKGKSYIKNASRLRLKESDRLKCIAHGLRALGGDIKEVGDGLEIIGDGDLSGGAMVHAENDHRIAMALAIAGAYSKKGIEIAGAEAIDKSYPAFLSDFSRLGGKVNVI